VQATRALVAALVAAHDQQKLPTRAVDAASTVVPVATNHAMRMLLASTLHVHSIQERARSAQHARRRMI
jgi:hypothetical protein